MFNSPFIVFIFYNESKVKYFSLDPSKSHEKPKKEYSALTTWGKKYRRSVEKLADLRNKMESSSGKQRKRYQKQYERQLKKLRKAMSGAWIEKRIPIMEYKNAVTTKIGGELDRGAAVVVNIYNHYVRLQAIHDDHVVVDDPGSEARANRNVTWAEARAMGYFRKRLVIEA